MLHIRDQKLVKDEARGVRWVMICQGMIGYLAYFASTTVNKTIPTADPDNEPITNGCDQGSELPPKDVASINNATEATSVIAPAQSTSRSLLR